MATEGSKSVASSDEISIPAAVVQIIVTLTYDPRYLVIEGKEVLFCPKVFKMLQRLVKEECLSIPPEFTLEQAICTVAERSSNTVHYSHLIAKLSGIIRGTYPSQLTLKLVDNLRLH